MKKKFKLKNPKKNLISLLIFLFISAGLNTSGQNLISNGNMESATGWTIYQLSTVPVSYEFNYIIDGPAGGTDGCLKIEKTSTVNEKKNIIFWQYVNLIAGKSYYIDANVKIGPATQFWCEFYLSAIVPVAGVDYLPNGNADRLIGYSTWDGCGPNSDGLMSEKYCINKLPFIVPGTKGNTVQMVFGFKTGSNTTNLDIKFDNIVLKLAENWSLISTNEGILDEGNKAITGVSPFISIADFVHGLEYPATANLLVIGENSGNTIASNSTAKMADTLIIRVEGNQTTDYNIELRPVGTGNDIISLLNGTINNTDTTVTNLPDDAKVFQLISSVVVSQYATYEVSTKSGQPLVQDTFITDDLQVIVTAENGDKKTYSITIGSEGLAVMNIIDSTGTMSQLNDYWYNLSGKINWRLTDAEKPFKGSILNIQSEDVWLYFDYIRPSKFNSDYLKYILVDSAAPVIDVNIRVVQYVEGTVVISHPSSFKPMEIFSGENLTGNSMELAIYTYNKSAQLGNLNDSIKSFRLKKGYMATLARDENGSGYSRVYIADTGDIVVDSLPAGLYDKVSFARVIPWRWVSKKAWRGGTTMAGIVGATSFYDYNNVALSTPDIEYIPMRHNPGWNAFSNINAQKNCTHALGYNEPDNSVDDGYSTIDGAIQMWPNLMESGLRLGSPAVTDGGLTSWLYPFMDRCDALNYRVDFVAWHFYRANQTPAGFYNALKGVYERTGRPIWITEWNNGCNWTYSATNPPPSYEENGIAIEEFTKMLDTAFFVERYFVWDGCNASLRMTYDGTSNLTPAGIAYRDQISSMAFNHDNEFYKEYLPFPEKAYNPEPIKNALDIPKGVQLSWTPGELATSHRIYLGINAASLSFKKTVTDSVFDPGVLLPNTRYYWRIDEVYSGRITAGDLWWFKTGDYVNINSVRDEQEFKIYPQPANDILIIEGIENEINLEIFNVLGNKVMIVKNNGKIDISSLPDGIYILKADNVHPVRFVKEK